MRFYRSEFHLGNLNGQDLGAKRTVNVKTEMMLAGQKIVEVHRAILFIGVVTAAITRMLN